MNDEEYEREMKRILDRGFKNAIHRPTTLALMSTLNLTEEEAMDALKIPESERDHLKSMIAQ